LNQKRKLYGFKLLKWALFLLYLALLVDIVILKEGHALNIASGMGNQTWAQR
jgi:short-subunit dehydrogenase